MEKDLSEVEDSQSMVFMKEFLAGGISGIAGLVVGHPFDTIKTIMQNSSKSQLSVFYKVRETHNNFAFFRGLSTPVASFFVINALIFGSFKPMYQWLDPQGKKISATFIAGSFAGSVQLVVIVPTELIKIKMQVTGVKKESRYETLTGCIRQTIKNEGIFKGFYRGFFITACRDIPGLGVYFSVYYTLRDILYSSMENLYVSASVAGATAGVMSWLVSLPMDVIKTRIQSGSNRNIMDCVRAFRPYGIGIYFTGAKVICIRAVISNSVVFVTYEAVVTLLYGD